ncbi:MAG: lipoyl synthase [Deltaproteobacteria bacterium]
MAGRPLPAWLRQPIPSKDSLSAMSRVAASGARTVCREAKCPNFGACISEGSLTFLILGGVCTRRCRFCNVEKDAKPSPPDPDEAGRIVRVMRDLGITYCVVTSVTRDDLPDGGAGSFLDVIRRVREDLPGIRIEVLIPDFGGERDSIRTVASGRPDVAGHNVETVPRLYAELRPGASYSRSLDVLRSLKDLEASRLVKTALMLGLGETSAETESTMRHISDTGCDVLCLGQYLAPTAAHAPVRRYVEPAEFARLRKLGLEMGFKEVISGPLVRSSYKAGDVLKETVRGRSLRGHPSPI